MPIDEKLLQDLERDNVIEVLLSYRNLSDEDVITLALLLKKNISVKLIDLFGNQIGDMGANALSEALRENKSVILVDLGWNQVGDIGARALGKVLKKNQWVLCISLFGNPISMDIKKEIEQLVACNKVAALCEKAEETYRKSKGLMQTHGIAEDVGVAFTDAKNKLREGAQKGHRRSQLMFQRVEQEWKDIILKLCRDDRRTELQKIQALKWWLTPHMDLSCQGLTDSDLDVLLKALKDSYIETLDLSRNTIGKAGGEALAAFLPTSKTLKVVALSGNKNLGARGGWFSSSSGIQYIFDALTKKEGSHVWMTLYEGGMIDHEQYIESIADKKCPLIRLRLELCDMALSEADGQMLLTVLKSQPEIIVKVDGNHITKPTLDRIERRMVGRGVSITTQLLFENKQETHQKSALPSLPVPSQEAPQKSTPSLPPPFIKKEISREDKSSRTYWYSVTDGYRLMLDLRKRFFEEVCSEEKEEGTRVRGGEPYSSVRYNTKRVFVSDPYWLDSFEGQLASDIDAMTGQASYGSWKWPALPCVLIFPFIAYAHWRVIRVEIDYLNAKASILWDDPYGVDVYVEEPMKEMRRKLRSILGSEIGRLIDYVAQWWPKSVTKRKEGSLEIDEVHYKSFAQQPSGNSYDCGPIAFQNVRDYADAAKSNRAFVDESKYAEPLYTIPAASVGVAYEEAITKCRREDKEILRGWEEKPDVEEELRYQRRTIEGLAAGIKGSPERIRIMEKIEELSPAQVDLMFKLLWDKREKSEKEKPFEASELKDAYDVVMMKPMLTKTLESVEAGMEQVLVKYEGSKDVLAEIKKEPPVYEYLLMFHKTLEAFYHGYSAVYSGKVTSANTGATVAEITADAFSIPYLSGVAKYVGWQVTVREANQVTDFFGLKPLVAITQMMFGFTLAFREKIKEVAREVRKGWKWAWEMTKWAVFACDLDTPVKELAFSHARWIVNKGVSHVPVYEGVESLAVLLKQHEKELPSQMRSLVPEDFQESVVQMVQQLSRIERIGQEMVTGVARVEVTTTATHAHVVDSTARIERSLSQGHEKMDTLGDSTAKMQILLNEMAGEQRVKINNLEGENRILKKSNEEKDGIIKKRDAQITGLKKENTHLKKQLHQVRAQTTEEESKEEDFSDKDAGDGVRKSSYHGV